MELFKLLNLLFMNIALFSDSYTPTKSGVVTVVIQDKKILEEMGHHVVVVTVGRGRPECEDGDPNVFRTKCKVLPVDKGQYFGLPNTKEIVEFLKPHNIDIIHSHTEFQIGKQSYKVGKKLGVPVVASTHTLWELYYKYYLKGFGWLPKSLIRFGVKVLYKPFYAFINVSEKAHNYFKESFMLPQIPSAIIPNAIDSRKFISHKCTEEEKAELRKSLGIKEGEKVVLYVGRIVQEKRMDELLAVAERVTDKRPGTKAVFVGAGTYAPTLQKISDSHGYKDKILFTGFIDWTKLSAYYEIGDVFITVSLSEMHSMTILEALNLGVPVVCRYDTSFSDTVYPGENGFFADSDEEMDDKIIQILDDDELQKKMKSKAVEIAQRFTLEAHGKKQVAFYEEVLKHFNGKVTDEELQAAVDKSVQ